MGAQSHLSSRIKPIRSIKLLVTTASVVLLVGCSGPGSKQSFGAYLDDSVLTSRVKATLIKAPDVSGYAVEVETLDRIVQLSGFVQSHAERRRAIALAKKTKGVTEVRDAMIVKR